MWLDHAVTTTKVIGTVHLLHPFVFGELTTEVNLHFKPRTKTPSAASKPLYPNTMEALPGEGLSWEDGAYLESNFSKFILEDKSILQGAGVVIGHLD